MRFATELRGRRASAPEDGTAVAEAKRHLSYHRLRCPWNEGRMASENLDALAGAEKHAGRIKVYVRERWKAFRRLGAGVRSTATA
jgi:hypothetical protein